MFTATLFTIAKTWKQPRDPLTDECIEKLRYVYTMEYYSAIKRNKFESVVVRQMNLQPLVQSKVSQKEKDKYILRNVYMESRKMVLNNLFAGHQKSKRVPEKHLFLLY